MTPYDVIILDLDLTLWPFRVDACRLPFQRNSDSEVIDSSGNTFELYPETRDVLEYLTSQGYKLGIASRIENIFSAYQLLYMFKIAKYFTYKEVYPVSKDNHIKRIARDSNAPFDRMAFFDDDKRNFNCVSRLGVSVFIVKGGLTLEYVKNCLNLKT